MSRVNENASNQGRYPRGSLEINFLRIRGENLGANPTVKLTAPGIRFLKHEQEYSQERQTIQFWFWCFRDEAATSDAVNGDENATNKQKHVRKRGTLTIIIETEESEETAEEPIGDVEPVDPDGPIPDVVLPEEEIKQAAKGSRRRKV